ncbi:hypothetical protein NliqN6_3756 [Naganishia liquefaciens]|uniref:BZIP domain-containing protein n=1 Tax=Naganishia liquefaciens TaxID=104408 RepID=A0A8H3YF90_9TREE|nr:hypothetical protein NliqN6_3756 [Naganishia liquefaciens]
MTRGRAPNLSLPLTKALAQQRDYRARKAANIARLETENEQLRSENSRLIRELDVLRKEREHGRDRQHQLSNPLSTSASASPTTASSEANARMLAEYQHLRANYEALEAEVRRKEHVLQVLRDKERESFARLEGLLKQSYDLVGSDIAYRPNPTAIYPLPSTIKEESLHHASTTPALAPPEPYGASTLSLTEKPASFANGHSPGNRDSQFLSDSSFAPGARTTGKCIQRESSVSPVSDEWRANKRLRSSSTAMTQVDRPQQVGEYPPLASHNRYDARESVLTHSLPHIVPHATEGPGGLLPLQYRRSSYTHLHSTSNRHPELTHAMYPLENGLLPTNASLAGKSSLPRDRSGRKFTRPSSSLTNDPSTGFLKDDAACRDGPFPDIRLPPALVSREDPCTVGIRSNDLRPSTVGTEKLPDMQSQGILSTDEPRAFDRPSELIDSATFQILPDGSLRPRSAITSSGICQQSEQSGGCEPRTKCAASCVESAMRSAGSAAIIRNCESPAANTAPRSELPSINNLAPRTSEENSLGNAASDAPPVSGCCNGLFDCTSLPSSLWMPLHAMSTSYERGNVASQPPMGISKAGATSPQSYNRSERSIPLDSGASLPNADIANLVNGTVKPELATPPEGEKGKLLASGTGEECCFGIVQCDAS